MTHNLVLGLRTARENLRAKHVPWNAVVHADSGESAHAVLFSRVHLPAPPKQQGLKGSNNCM